LGRMRQQAQRLHQQGEGKQAERLQHFVKVSASYEAGLFHCYDVVDLPRTNNELEQFFGSYRHHERRVSGRKVASASLVVRGAVRPHTPRPAGIRRSTNRPRRSAARGVHAP